MHPLSPAAEVYTVAMALMDYLPPLAFLCGAFFLAQMLRSEGCRAGLRWLAPGAGLVFLAGALQATWKLFMALRVGDFSWMREAQFVLMAPGFLFILVGLLVWVRAGKPALQPVTLAPAMAVWKIPFLAVMTLCNLGMQGVLVTISFRRGARLAAALFIISVLCVFAMAGMASGEQGIARQWIEQTINVVGQAAFAGGAYLLYRKGA